MPFRSSLTQSTIDPFVVMLIQWESEYQTSLVLGSMGTVTIFRLKLIAAVKSELELKGYIQVGLGLGETPSLGGGGWVLCNETT